MLKCGWVITMNILHVKYAVEVAKAGSLNKASENLFVALPNISRSIKELEADLGIVIFERSAKGVTLTPDGEEFIGYAKGLLKQISNIENLYKGSTPRKQRFSLSVPRSSYISEAFSELTKSISKDAAEIFYMETNSKMTIDNLLNHDYRLGIIRYAKVYDEYFKSMLREKDLSYECVMEFSYSLIMSAQNPLSQKEEIRLADLVDYIEIARADPYVPSLPFSKVVKEELTDDIERRIFVFERASQFEILSGNPETFMWVSPTPRKVLDQYGLVQRRCKDNQKIYRDLLVHKKDYKLTDLDKIFIEALSESKRKYL